MHIALTIVAVELLRLPALKLIGAALLVVFASQLLLKAMDRFPINIITVGAASLGWVAGEMAIGDPLVKGWIDAQLPWLHVAAPLAGALVVVIGKTLPARTGALLGSVARSTLEHCAVPAAGGARLRPEASALNAQRWPAASGAGWLRACCDPDVRATPAPA
jgi:hypothetical protein